MSRIKQTTFLFDHHARIPGRYKPDGWRRVLKKMAYIKELKVATAHEYNFGLNLCFSPSSLRKVLKFTKSFKTHFNLSSKYLNCLQHVHLQKVRFSEPEPSKKSINFLSKLGKKTPMKKISLNYSEPFDESKIKWIAKVLHKRQNIKAIKIWFSKKPFFILTEKSTTLLASALKKCKGLRILKLCTNFFGKHQTTRILMKNLLQTNI